MATKKSAASMPSKNTCVYMPTGITTFILTSNTFSIQPHSPSKKHIYIIMNQPSRLAFALQLSLP